jgi:hypothetical protein
MHSIKFLFFIILFFGLTSCSRQHLSIYTDYLSHKNLASYRVETPDPLLADPPIGQRLIISWSLPKAIFSKENLRLEARIRFKNREEVKENISLCKRSGTYMYSLINEDFFDKGGIFTYKVDLISNDTVLEEWRHQLWTELILFDEEK